MQKKTKNKAASEMAKRRWSKTTPKERSEHGKNLVSKRKWRPTKD